MSKHESRGRPAGKPWRTVVAARSGIVPAQLRRDGASHRSAPRGITLLELLLALALTGVVLVVIAMAIDLHLRTLDTRRAGVEEAQVARAVLRTIAADIRCAVWYEPIDMSGAQQMISDSGTDSLLDAVAEASSDPPAETDADAGMDAASAIEDLAADMDLDGGMTLNTMDIAGTVQPTSVPGLYGNQYELQIDVSRLPRVDQYEPMGASEGTPVADIPSDVKTVAYFLGAGDVLGGMAVGSSSDAATLGGGLRRRQLDRAVANWSASIGELDAESHPGEMLAAEVNYLEFRYFDGIDWLTEWDSEELGCLPLAIEITIGIDPTGGESSETLDVGEVLDVISAAGAQNLYRRVVHLPLGKAVPLDDASLETSALGELAP